MQFGNVYATGATDPRRIVERARDTGLGRESFDTMIGTGLSGALVIPTLAEALGKQWAIVRKQDDATHSSYNIEGSIGERWLFVDDLVSSGRTFHRVRDQVDKACREFKHHTEFVGAWLYSRSEHYKASEIEARTGYRAPAVHERKLEMNEMRLDRIEDEEYRAALSGGRYF